MAIRQSLSASNLRPQPRGYSAGTNCFSRFLSYAGRPALVASATTSEIGAVLVEFINYIIDNEASITCFKTLCAYLIHVKDDFKSLCASCQSSDAYASRWPTRSKKSGYDCFPLQAALDGARLFYKEFESTGRSVLTPGILQNYALHLDFHNPIDVLTWATAWLSCCTGTRAGEILSPLFTREKIDISPHATTLRVFNGKANEWQNAVAFVHEWDPVVKHFGGSFNLTQMLNSVARNRNTPNDAPFFMHNKYILSFKKYSDRLVQLNKLVGIQRGKVGPHSGRIYFATLMFHQGKPEDEIMRRGRWRGVCWKRYARSVLQPKNANAFWLRIGQVSTDLSQCPTTAEFVRGFHYC